MSGPPASRIAAWSSSSLAGDHPAIGVRDHHQALDAEQVPREHERRQDVVGDARAGVAEDLRVAGLEPEHRERVDPRVDAGQHGEAAGRAPVEAGRGEVARVGRVRRQYVREMVVLGHGAIVPICGVSGIGWRHVLPTHKRPKSAAELANKAEIDKLAKEATLGELQNEVGAMSQSQAISGFDRPSGFFNSPGVEMPDDKPYEGDGKPSS